MKTGTLLAIATLLFAGPITGLLLWRIRSCHRARDRWGVAGWTLTLVGFQIGMYGFLTFGGRNLMDWWLA